MITNTTREDTTVQTILSEYKSLLVEADSLFRDYVRAHHLKLACGPACSECCQCCILVYFIEAYYVQMAVQALGPETRHSIRLRAAKNIPGIERLERIADAIEERSGGVIQGARANLSYLMRWKIRCPFVGEQGGCLIHSHRPAIARCFGVPLKIWGDEEIPMWCNENTSSPYEPLYLDACSLQEKVIGLSRTLELILTGQEQPKRPIWFGVLFPLERLISGGEVMEKEKLDPKDHRLVVRRRLLKLGAYSVPAIATMLASRGAYGQAQYKQSKGSGSKNKSSGFS